VLSLVEASKCINLFMSDTVIKIEDLWKQYRYGVISHGMLVKDIQSWWARAR
jgi:lipopolysaccharide transport system ATP-binding protein